MARRVTVRSLAGTVLLFDFGAQVEGYRSDMTRTLFVGEPTARDLEIYELVARAQAAPIAALEAAVAPAGASGRASDAMARDVIVEAGHGEHFGHGTGHGIGLATHEAPCLGQSASETRSRARRCSRSSPGSISTARSASASRISSPSTPRPAGSSA